MLAVEKTLEMIQSEFLIYRWEDWGQYFRSSVFWRLLWLPIWFWSFHTDFDLQVNKNWLNTLGSSGGYEVGLTVLSWDSQVMSFTAVTGLLAVLLYAWQWRKCGDDANLCSLELHGNNYTWIFECILSFSLKAKMKARSWVGRWYNLDHRFLCFQDPNTEKMSMYFLSSINWDKLYMLSIK